MGSPLLQRRALFNGVLLGVGCSAEPTSRKQPLIEEPIVAEVFDDYVVSSIWIYVVVGSEVVTESPTYVYAFALS